MKKIKFILSIIITTSLVSCVNTDDYGTPPELCVDLSANVTVQDVNALANSTAQQIDFTVDTEDYVEALVTSSDEGGNFYKSISLITLDGTKGFTIPVDDYNLYTKFEPGRKVFVNMDALYFHYNSQISSLEIGDLFNNYTPDILTDDKVGRISKVMYENVIKRSCTKVNEDDIVKHLTINQAKNNANLNMLIEFDAVQFTDGSMNGKYYDKDYPNLSFSNPVYPSNIGGATNHKITDELGNTIIVRVSEFASFATNAIPSGNGKIRGVLTKYNSDYQFMIRTINDVQLPNPRIEIDFFPPLVGGSLVYNSTLNEPFTSYTTTNQQNFPAYINDAATGSRYWQRKNFSGNTYIQMSSFGGTPEANRSLFIVPIDMTGANNLQFKTKTGYNNGATLKVYYTTNYVPGNQITTATLVDITSSFTIDNGPSGAYSTNFLNSGVYNIPVGVTGNGFFVFEYIGNGTGGPTTTMQIDDIVIN